MGILSISFARFEALTSDFFFSFLPEAIRIAILIIGVVTTSYRRLIADRRYAAAIDENSTRFVYRNGSGSDSCECLICLCQIGDGDEVRRLNCNHVFHRSCLDPWLRSGGASGNCPLCRCDVLPWEELEEYRLVMSVAAESVFEKELALVLLSGLSCGGCAVKLPMSTTGYH